MGLVTCTRYDTDFLPDTTLYLFHCLRVLPSLKCIWSLGKYMLSNERLHMELNSNANQNSESKVELPK